MECVRQTGWANPSSAHGPGRQARRVLEEARSRLARLLGANLDSTPADRIIFTSGATEANNLAILGIARAGRSVLDPATLTSSTRAEVLVSAGEHSSVLEPAQALFEREGFEYHTVPMTHRGVAREDLLHAFLSPRSVLASVATVNHDTGVIQPIATLAKICREHDVPLHTDAVQAIGRIPVDFRQLDVAALTISGHKLGGPRGIGALLLRGETAIDPILFGGPQENSLRPGTEPIDLIVGLVTAVEHRLGRLAADTPRMLRLQRRFESELAAALPEVVINGAEATRVPYVSNIAPVGCKAEKLAAELDEAGVICSVGSACSSTSADPSPTLRAMGLDPAVLDASLRLSFSPTTSEAEVEEATRRIIEVVHRQRGAV